MTDDALKEKLNHIIYQVKQLLIESDQASFEQQERDQNHDLVDSILDDLYKLHSFAFKDYRGHELEEVTEFMQQNIVVQLLGTGNSDIIEHFYSSGGECNMRAQLISETMKEI